MTPDFNGSSSGGVKGDNTCRETGRQDDRINRMQKQQAGKRWPKLAEACPVLPGAHHMVEPTFSMVRRFVSSV